LSNSNLFFNFSFWIWCFLFSLSTSSLTIFPFLTRVHSPESSSSTGGFTAFFATSLAAFFSGWGVTFLTSTGSTFFSSTFFLFFFLFVVFDCSSFVSWTGKFFFVSSECDVSLTFGSWFSSVREGTFWFSVTFCVWVAGWEIIGSSSSSLLFFLCFLLFLFS